jgi:butyryl-CoA dehydrogenase
MRIRLSEDHELIRKTVQEFMDTEVAPIAAEIDRTGVFPAKTVARMGELGLMGINVPEEYGGAGADTVSFALVAEELTRVCATHAVIYGANNTLTCNPLNNFGTPEQKEEHLVPLATGRAFGSYALTEPGAGSDAASLITRAEKDGDDYIVNGTKVFISNGSVADTMIVFARTGGPGPKGVSAFIVPPKRTPGVTVGPNEKKLGLRGSPTNQIFFKDARVPKENLLGREGEGFKIAMATLDTGRIMAAAASTGMIRACREESTAYAQERRQFGAVIGSFQAIQWKLADMRTHEEAARLLYLNAAWRKDQKLPYTKEASMAKVFATEKAMDATIENIQVHGGNGYTSDYPAERHFRDIKVFEIFEGTSEIQRMVIARHILEAKS